MKRLIVICEGRSEVNFIKNVISCEFSDNISFEPRTIPTGKNPNGGNAKGGSLDYDRVRKYIINTLKEIGSSREGSFVTTFFDYYKLSNKFPKFNQATQKKDIYKTISELEEAFYKDICDNRFIPYIQLHEFESLIFCDIEKLFEKEDINQKNLTNLKNTLSNFGNNPELINGGYKTAPSKVILNNFSGYQKTLHGYTALSKIGIGEICNQCKHFREWIAKIKSI